MLISKLRAIKVLALAVVLFFVSLTVLPLPAQAKVNRYLSGNPEDVNPQLHGFAYNIGGGGPDVDPAIQWMINTVRGCTNCDKTVDFVVIRDTGRDGYNDIILAMEGVDSVETLVISKREDADHSDVVEAVKNAEVIFFAGGDQCQYLRNYRNTGIEDAVKSVINRGGAVGGTSAGAMIQSEFVFNACGNTVVSSSALSSPYQDIGLNQNFFNWKNLENTVIDTHFYERDRMGRLMTFVARLIRDGATERALGIGVDEGTSILIDQEGLATVLGDGYAYFVLGDHLPEQCEPETSLTFKDYKVWKKGNGETFNLATRNSKGYKLVSVNRGQLRSDPY